MEKRLTYFGRSSELSDKTELEVSGRWKIK